MKNTIIIGFILFLIQCSCDKGYRTFGGTGYGTVRHPETKVSTSAGRFTGPGLFIVLVCLAMAPVHADDVTNGWIKVTDQAPFPDRLLASVVAFDNHLWVMGGETSHYSFFSDVWRSDDGRTWTLVTPQAAFGKRGVQRSVVFNNRMWVIAGREGGTLAFRNDVWSSGDGITWTEETPHAAFANRTDFAAVVFDNRIWVIGGNVNDGSVGNDVWYSADGKTWTLAAAHAQFPARMNPSACVYKGKIWLTGGFDWSGVFNDVWSSEDGITWTKETEHAPFSARRYQRMDTYNDKLWVIGGYDGKEPLNDLWWSDDGKTWTRVQTSTSYPAGWGFDSVVYDNRLWVIGVGSGNDVWYYAEPANPANECSRKPCITVVKEVDPVSIKEGTETTITLKIFNNGTSPVHDIQVLDPGLPDFPVTGGNAKAAWAGLDPADSRILRYHIQAMKPGSFSLPAAKVMYADTRGNYHVDYSGTPHIVVLAPLFPEPENGNDPGSDLFAWFKKISSGIW
jgi:hypothetical protein